MPRIRILSPELCNKIAAGEVIERPASVLKELLENSIDAGSSFIRIEILGGGKRLIKVTDNGAGMDKEDVRLAFERHATSKLINESGLYNIRTLGFRGEALPSIASVSMVKVVTGISDSESGTMLEIHGSEIQETKDSPPVRGTSIEVRDIFFNTPARKKFLKSNNTELYHIIDTATKAALANRGIGFTLITDRREAMNLPPASGLNERLMQIFGKEFLDRLTKINTHQQDIALEAFVSEPQSFRKTKSSQFIFINGRPVRDASVSRAVYRAYEGILPQDRHPVFFLFIDMDPNKIDFNVHPAKKEVRFSDKEPVYRFINSSVHDAVKERHTEYVRHFAEPSSADAPQQAFRPDAEARPPFAPLNKSIVSENLELAYRPFLPCIYLGDTFIAVSGKGGLTIIDHHAAHERILFEKLLHGISSVSRQLLFPKQVRLSAGEYAVLLKHLDAIKDLGIDVEDFGSNTVIVRSLPDEINGADLDSVMSDIAAGLLDSTLSRADLKKDIASLIACHSSIRGKRILSQEEVSRLMEDLEKTEHPDQCPHGRPTRIFYSLDDLNRLFKRK